MIVAARGLLLTQELFASRGENMKLLTSIQAGKHKDSCNASSSAIPHWSFALLAAVMRVTRLLVTADTGWTPVLTGRELSVVGSACLLIVGRTGSGPFVCFTIIGCFFACTGGR